MKVLDRITSITRVGCLSGELLAQNILEVEINDSRTVVEMNNREDFRIQIPLHFEAGEKVQLEVNSNISRSSVEAGHSSDKGALAFYLKEIHVIYCNIVIVVYLLNALKKQNPLLETYP